MTTIKDLSEHIRDDKPVLFTDFDNGVTEKSKEDFNDFKALEPQGTCQEDYIFNIAVDERQLEQCIIITGNEQ